MEIKTLLKDPRTNWKYLIIILILATVVGAGILGYQYFQKEKTDKWETYRNEKIGVEFQYSEKIFGEPHTTRVISLPKGEKIEIIFSKEKGDSKEYADLYFKANNSINYGLLPIGFLDFSGFGDINRNCQEPLKLKGTHLAANLGMCKTIEVAGQKAIFETFATNVDCVAYFDVYVYFNNQSNSPYKGLAFILRGLDINNKVLRFMPDCMGGGDMEKFKSDFYTQSINIMKNQNLSEGDKAKLNTFNQMFSTFRFFKVDETTDWKTYRNEEIGFEVKYPDNWYYSINSDLGKPNMEFCSSFFYDEKNKLCIEQKEWEEGVKPMAKIYLYITTTTVDKKYWKGTLEERKKESGFSYTKIIVDRKEGDLYEAVEAGLIQAVLERDSLDPILYLLSAPEINSFPHHRDIFNQMLSTFRFLE